MIKKLLSKCLILKLIQAQGGFYRENMGEISGYIDVGDKGMSVTLFW